MKSLPYSVATRPDPTNLSENTRKLCYQMSMMHGLETGTKVQQAWRLHRAVLVVSHIFL